VEPDFQLFSFEILNEPIPANYVFPKIGSFNGKQDLNAHVKNFRAQMLIYGGSDAVRCKMLAGSLTDTRLDWFNNFPEGSVTSLEVFVRLLVAHFAANKTKLPDTADLFDVRQARGEAVKQYLHRFNEVVVQISQPNEGMCVEAFIRQLRSGSFGESLVKKRPANMADINLWIVSYVKVEEFARKKIEERRVKMGRNQR